MKKTCVIFFYVCVESRYIYIMANLTTSSFVFLLELLPELARRGAFEVDEFAVVSNIREEMLAVVSKNPGLFEDASPSSPSESSSSDGDVAPRESRDDHNRHTKSTQRRHTPVAGLPPTEQPRKDKTRKKKTLKARQ